MKGDGRMKKKVMILCFMLALLTVTAAYSSGLLISDLPAEIEVGNNKPTEFEFNLNNSEGIDITNAALMIEEVVTGSDSEELLGIPVIISVNGEKPEEETDFADIEMIPAGSVIPVKASYLLTEKTNLPISVKVTLYDEDFEVITYAKARCTMPETVKETNLAIFGIPVTTILIVLAAMNVLAWGFVLIRFFRNRKAASRCKA